MRNVAVGSVVTLILVTGLFVSQVEAKNDNDNDKGKNKQEYKFDVKHYKHDDRRSVPIPGTLLALGGGLVGLVAWRARQRKPRD